MPPSLDCIPHEYKRGVFVLIIEGEPWKEVHASIFGKSPLTHFKASTESYFFEVEKRLTKAFLLRRLAMKNYSSFELRHLLSSRLVTEKTIESLVKEFTDLGYLNDEDWIQSTVRSLIKKKQGPRNIALKLKAKGVPEEIVKRVVEEPCSGQEKQIQSLLESKYRNKDLSNYKERQKVISSLLRRGFNYEAIRSSISED